MSLVDVNAGSVGSLASNAIGNQAKEAVSTVGGGIGGIGGTSIFGEGGIASMAIGGLETLGNIWSSFQQIKLAKKTLKFQKEAFRTNLKNSTQVYNTALEDRIRARYHTEGRSDEADAKIEANRL